MVFSVLLHRVLIYQKRWVKLDAVYLKYFDNDKVRTDAPSYANTFSIQAAFCMCSGNSENTQYVTYGVCVCSQYFQ